ncbi:MAG: fructose-1,6-bisphosphate aldolase/phosphatase [Thermoplasmatales archaeon]|jgi:D-fructose 1,6-bisphosphatase (EC 3.1.3.11)
MKVTLSVIKADVGGLAGHSRVHPDLKNEARLVLENARDEGKIIDFYVTAVGDDLQLIITHNKGEGSPEIHKMAWDAFIKATEVAKKLKLYGAGQDLLKDSFSGNLKGMGPGVAEMEFEERKSEPVAIFMMDKTEPGAFNLPIYKIFADPFNTAGLVIDPNMHHGFDFEIWDVIGKKAVTLHSPDEIYDILALIGSKGRYVIKRVYPGKENKHLPHEPVAVVSTDKLQEIAGKYVGKDDPVAIVRAQAGLPAMGEVLEPFAYPHLVSGWMRGSHNGPIMPVSEKDATPSRFDGPPRVIGLGFQLSEGRLVGPADLLGDVAFDNARRLALEITDYIRRMGPFEPHRLPDEEMEYTTLNEVRNKLSNRFRDL